MNAAEKLQSLYEIIDQYVALEKGKNEGPFSFLREDMMTRFITTTPNRRAGVEGLKTYLAKDILQINDGKDYVTYKNILDNLEGTAKKKYQVDSSRLDDCFNWEKNRDIIEKDAAEFWIQREKGWKGLQQDCQIPWLLFKWLKEDVETHLLNFWKIGIMDKFDEPCEKKDEYMSALYGVALQEIFYRELLSKRLIQNWKTIQEKQKQIEVFLQEDGKEKLTEDILTEDEKCQLVAWKLRTISDMLSDFGGKLTEQSVYIVLDTEANLNLGVEIQLIMLFDSLNIQGKTGQALEQWVNLQQINLIGFFKDNPNRRKAYREIDSYVEEMFLSYWKNIPEGERKNFPWALNTYFEQLELRRDPQKKADNELMKRAQTIILQAMLEESRRKPDVR